MKQHNHFVTGAVVLLLWIGLVGLSTESVGADVNQFNRLMMPKSERNLPPPKDGIHDPANQGTDLLQTPKEAFTSMEPLSSGNYVNWVESLKKKSINPRYDRTDPKAEAVIFDLDIVREVKGSMPDVVYPHDRHTQWLDCSNCHPDIFVPEKGKNQISMAQILMGQKCGVCHGKVAFPVSECRLCHSKKKDAGGAAAAPKVSQSDAANAAPKRSK